MGHDDAYKSINEAFVHAYIENDCRVKLDGWTPNSLSGRPPGGAGGLRRHSRGAGIRQPCAEGKIKAVHYARTHQVPFLGIRLGMQVAAIEIAAIALTC